MEITNANLVSDSFILTTVSQALTQPLLPSRGPFIPSPTPNTRTTSKHSAERYSNQGRHWTSKPSATSLCWILLFSRCYA